MGLGYLPTWKPSIYGSGSFEPDDIWVLATQRFFCWNFQPNNWWKWFSIWRIFFELGWCNHQLEIAGLFWIKRCFLPFTHKKGGMFFFSSGSPCLNLVSQNTREGNCICKDHRNLKGVLTQLAWDISKRITRNYFSSSTLAVNVGLWICWSSSWKTRKGESLNCSWSINWTYLIIFEHSVWPICNLLTGGYPKKRINKKDFGESFQKVPNTPQLLLK